MDSTQELKAAAEALGFDLVGVAPAVSPGGFGALQEWLANGFAGEMEYIPRREPAYADPARVMDGVKSVVLTATNYHSSKPHVESESDARVSRYAWSDVDYHDVIKGRLKRLGDWLHEREPVCRTRAVVDTAPLLERDFARLAGLGWFGKNTMLLNKRLGSWFFLGALLVDVELPYDVPHETAHCGTCTRCLEACPTDAFPEPYVLDARRCISYLTIELRGSIPEALRPGMGNWLFGCDVCQDVCPWNRKSPHTDDPAFQPTEALNPVDVIEILNLDEQTFRDRFRKTPLWRTGRSGLVRNAAIVAANTQNASAIPRLQELRADPDPIIRETAAWALRQLTSDD